MSSSPLACNVCNQTGKCTLDVIHCVNCNNTIAAYYHRFCLINGPYLQSADCKYCTSDKKRMYVFYIYKVQYIVRHYAISKEKYDEVINVLYDQSILGVDRSCFDYEKFLMDDSSVQFQHNGFWYCVYGLLMCKYEISDENVEEAIKDQLYRSRTGLFTKCAIKK